MLNGRFDTDEEKKPIPSEWFEELVKIFNENYFDRSEKDNCFFDAYGELSSKELVVAVSYVHHEDQLKAPISVYISYEYTLGKTDTDKILEGTMQLFALIFDDIFAQDDWNEYNSNWTENEYQGNKYHYKITRENISLSIQAEKILAGELK